ncbi:putative UDP-glucuronosyltransferase 2B31-like [Apostichopus japonicus]|uniref:Putative UDP-glucuronosyltransferase 2B31-like n=1 Tax=Stichopus japonicus TaxID=307972 RepID=A0A2G8KZN0_STIJA|nr:putative UDP-glucuronosyltransferase 2B31-like [Apostichopus japonicus]
MWVMSASGHQTANILMVFEQPGTSHFKNAAAVARVLSSRGYNITFLLPEPYHTYPAASQYRDIFSFLHVMSSRFDLIMTDANFLWQQVLIQKMPDIPHGLISTTAASSLTNSWIRAPNLPSVLPGFMIRTHHRKPLSFFWRTYNTVFIYGAVIFFSAVLDPLMGVVTSSYSSSVSRYPTITFGLSDIWLTNADFSTDTPRPFLPNMVLVGGLNIEEPEPLSEVQI